MRHGEIVIAEAASSTRLDLIELAVGYALILVVLWTPPPWQERFYLVAVLFLAIATWRSFPGWRALGLRRTNLLRSMWVVAAALAVAALVIVIAIHLHTLRATNGFLGFARRYWGYALWAFVQQFLLQDFFFRRFRNLMPGRAKAAALAAAGIFALAHLPNPILAPVTFVWGLVACLIFLQYRNLIPISIAHAILGITLAIAIPGPVIRNMRVGLGFLTYHAPHHHRSHADHTVSTEA
jgi:membrane protease YdiL (CAAX protease family)